MKKQTVFELTFFKLNKVGLHHNFSIDGFFLWFEEHSCKEHSTIRF